VTFPVSNHLSESASSLLVHRNDHPEEQPSLFSPLSESAYSSPEHQVSNLPKHVLACVGMRSQSNLVQSVSSPTPNHTARTTISRDTDTILLCFAWDCHWPRGCYIVALLMTGFIGLSVFLGLFFTINKEYGYSMGDSFTLAGYVIAVGALITSLLFALHYPRCDCWRSKRVQPRNRTGIDHDGSSSDIILRDTSSPDGGPEALEYGV
jgi:hypothetical protein